MNFLPARHTDFIFSVFAEEWGFIGIVVLLALYILLITWGLDVAIKAKDRLGMLMGCSVVTIFGFYCVINIGMTLGVFPVVGIPLPLMSYGGTSMITTLFSLGILFNIRKKRFCSTKKKLMYTDILLSVSKPSRYIGHEINAIRKEPSTVRTRVALIFPDTYEIGMSHLGLKILYHILNNIDDVAAERAFVPWTDMEELLTSKGLPLLSVESSLPLAKFDIIGFTLPYELCYTNILTTLSLSGIPLHSSGRDAAFPLIIGGGSSVFNPEPVADFFDAFFLGDGEEGIVEILHTYNTWKESGASKESLLIALSQIKGVYVPSLYKVEYNDDKTILAIHPFAGVTDTVQRRIVEDLDRVPFPTSPALPYMQVVHDRLTVEIARGCTHGCRFCQAGITYRPVRERSPEKILEIIEDSLKNTGYEEVSLSSLSTGDFACLSDTLTSLIGNYSENRVSFSLPSLRIGTLTPAIIEQITGTKIPASQLRLRQELTG